MSHLKAHTIVHTGERSFECHLCPQRFSARSRLNVHLRTHTGERPFQCPSCLRSFQQKTHLNVHLRIHTGERPFQCPSCPRSFSLKSTLTDHLRSDTGERPFQCPSCPQSFSLKCTLRNHLRTHTGERPFQCHLCRKTFAYRSNLTKHLRHHKGKCSTSERDRKRLFCIPTAKRDSARRNVWLQRISRDCEPEGEATSQPFLPYCDESLLEAHSCLGQSVATPGRDMFDSYGFDESRLSGDHVAETKELLGNVCLEKPKWWSATGSSLDGQAHLGVQDAAVPQLDDEIVVPKKVGSDDGLAYGFDDKDPGKGVPDDRRLKVVIGAVDKRGVQNIVNNRISEFVYAAWRTSSCQAATMKGDKSHEGCRHHCNFCGYKTDNICHLKRHNMLHTGEQPFECHLCPQRFRRKYNLKLHLRTHTGERPFQCRLCLKTFAFRSNLTRHLSYHKGK
ncbi:uncharacterized protein LOC142563403 [Dermacentor variabilis]|uniref:uncharacterized protein LOC142563403 n=1 Tax=Dermacentor variabilis TaxID=34621 RepID=UPI003F5BCEA8